MKKTCLFVRIIVMNEVKIMMIYEYDYYNYYEYEYEWYH